MAKRGASRSIGSSAASGSAKASIEQELKLSAESTFRLPSSLGRPLPIHRFTSKYYDSHDHRLAQAGITLRRRTEGGSGLWQLKLPIAAARQEVELAGPSGLPPASIQELLIAHLRNVPLKEVATLRTHRQGVRITNRKGDTADIVLDHVSVLENRRAVRRFREIEIELVKGKGRILAELEEALREAGAGDHDGRPKLFRALDFPGCPKREPPATDASVGDQLAYSLRRQLDVLLAHDPGTRLGRDPEHLHQMRVATRRLRAIFRSAGPLLASAWAEPLREDLAWLGGLLGSVRDLDVQIGSFRREARRLEAPDRRPLIQFMKTLEADRGKRHADLLAGLRSERYLGFLERFIQAVNAPNVIESDLTLRDIAEQEFKRLRKAVHRLPTVPSDAELHRVRIKAKRARYAAELVEQTAGKPVMRFIRCAKTVQDLLGKHQDAVVAEQRIRALFAEANGQRAAFTAGRMVERQRQRRDHARAVFWSLWGKLDKRGRRAWK
jgi:CHAD domain-containing protein